jgi:transcriptional regulator GlxA family with amidase domain
VIARVEDVVGDGERQTARVGFLLISGFSMLAYVAAIESLRAANQIARRPIYSWHHIAPSGDAATASNDVEIRCRLDVQSREPFSYIFVCASDEAAAFRDPHTLNWLRAAAARGTVMGGIGGGAYLLARAGLLTKRRMTLHWAYAPAFCEEFPDVDFRRSLYEIDEDRLTCGGGMSPLDMLHALFVREHGIALALAVSEWFLHTDVREGQDPQRLSLQARLGIHHAGLIRALEAMEDAIEDPLSRAELSEIAGVSERQLDRLFLQQLGTALSAYYLRLRLDRARALVTQSSMSQLEIAVATGFKSASTFSKSYRARYGLPPTAERSEVLRGRRGLI